MVAIPFKNKTNQTKFQGSFDLDSTNYEYTIYLLPIKKRKEINEIVSYFGNRMFQGNLCLKIDETDIKQYLKFNDVSAFIMVNPVGIDNIASGTLQIYDWCINPPSPTQSQSQSQSTSSGGSPSQHISISKSSNIDEADVWINDICRVSSGPNTGNPLKGLLFLMEQLVVQNLQKTNIKLYIKPKKENVAALKPKYESFGFEKNHKDEPNICPNWQGKEIVMEKIGLVPDTSTIDFSFLEQEPTPTPTPTPITTRTTRRTIRGTAKGVKKHKKTYRKHKKSYHKRK